MSQFARILKTEFLKLKRTIALWLAIAVPMAIVLLQFFVYWSRGEEMEKGLNPLQGFAQGVLTFWTLILVPFYGALIAALLAHIEHQSDNWKQIFTLPIR